jgi:hypothetical protein
VRRVSNHEAAYSKNRFKVSMPTDVITSLLRLRYAIAADDVLHRLATLKEACKANFNPNQPRVPAGNPDGGRWSSTGSSPGGVSATGQAPRTRMPSRGHHYVPQEVFRSLPFSAETRRVLDNARTGRLRAKVHRWGKEHRIYNDAVGEHLKRFLSERGISPQSMTPEQARSFVKEITGSSDSRIRNYNMRIFMGEIRYWMRRTPRSPE